MIINMLDNFNCYLKVLITLKLIVFKNIGQFFIFAVFVIFCLIVTETYYVVVPYLF